MTELVGEKIEKLLWAAGCDFDHELNEDEESGRLNIRVGESVVVLEELWWVEGEWTVEAETLTLERVIDGQSVDGDLYIAETEEELVEHILSLGGE